MADETRLVAVFDANLLGFTKGMEEARRVSDRAFGSIQAKMQQTERSLGGAFQKIGGAFGGLGLGRLLGVAAIEEFSRKVLTMTAGLVDQAKVLNVTVESLQAFREAMKDSGGSAEDADQILKRLTVTIGAAKLGASQATDVFAHLGLGPKDIEGTGEQVLVRVAKALLAIKDPTVRARLEVEAFNRSGQEFERTLADVAGGLDVLAAKYLAQNRIIADDTALKAKKALDDLSAAWSKLGTAAAPVITQTLTWLEQSIEGYKLLGAAVADYTNSFLRSHGLSILAAPLPDTAHGADTRGIAGDFEKHGGPRFQTQDEIAAAKKAAEEAIRFLKEMNQAANTFLSNWDRDFKQAFTDAQKSSRDAINQTRDDLARANEGRSIAEHATDAEIARGREDYFNRLATLALEETNARIAEIERQKRAQLTALTELGTHTIAYEQARANIEAAANADIGAAREQLSQRLTQLNEEQTRALQTQIEVMDNVRGGLENIGVAALHGARSFKDAVVQMISQLAEMSLRLYVLKPLIESVFGRGGTGGGFLDALINGQSFPDTVDITPGKFAAGGRPPMNKLSWIGENGPELWRPDQSGVIIPNANARAAGGGGNTIMIDARGAQIGVAEQITAALQRAAPQIVGASVNIVRKNFPGMIVNAAQRSL